MQDWMYILLVPGLILGAVALFFLIKGILRAAGAASGMGAGGFLKKHGWFIAGAVLVPLALFLLVKGHMQLVLILFGLLLAAMAVASFAKSKKLPWYWPAGVAAVVLFLAIPENVSILKNWTTDYRNWASSMAPAETADELQARFPRITGSMLHIAPGATEQVEIRHAVSLPPVACHYYNVQPDNGSLEMVQDNPANPAFIAIQPTEIGTWTYASVSLIRNTSDSRPEGC